MKAVIWVTLVLVFSLTANALEVYDKQCKSDGSLKLILKADNKAKVYTDNIQVKVGNNLMVGSWDPLYITQSDKSSREYATFQSEENVLTVKRSYPLSITYLSVYDEGNKSLETKSFEVECPGLVFSCKEMNISIESCGTSKDWLFRSVISIKGLEQSDAAKMSVLDVVDFVLDAENKYKDMSGKETSKGGLPLSSEVVRLDKDKYVLRYEFSSKKNNTINSLWVGFNKDLRFPCNFDKYPEVKPYDKVDCSRESDEDAGLSVEPVETPPKAEPSAKSSEVKDEIPQKSLANPNTKSADQILENQPKNYKSLVIITIVLVVVISIGGIVLSYLYKRGYI